MLLGNQRTFNLYVRLTRSSTLWTRDGRCWEASRTVKSPAPPAQLDPRPAVSEIDIHANHNRNDRPAPPTTTTTRPVQQGLPASSDKLPHPRFHPCACTDRQTRTNWDNPPPSLLPPTLPLHCALQQPPLRGLIPRSDHHLYLLC